MRTPEYLDALRARLSLPSDYALGKALDVTYATMQNWRHGRSHFDDELALRVAELLDMDPGRVLMDMYAQRAKSDQLRSVWKRLAESTTAVFFGALLAVILSATPAPAQAALQSGNGPAARAVNADALCIMSTRRTLRKHLKSILRRLRNSIMRIPLLSPRPAFSF